MLIAAEVDVKSARKPESNCAKGPHVGPPEKRSITAIIDNFDPHEFEQPAMKHSLEGMSTTAVKLFKESGI